MLPPLVICEGADDCAFLKKIIENRSIGSWSFHFDRDNLRRLGGVKNFGEILTAIEVEREILERRCVLIVADNDGMPASRFQDVQNQIRLAGYAPPESPRQPKAQESKLPPIIIFMLPWDSSQGCLETVCLSAAANANPRQLECVDSLMQCVGVSEWDLAKSEKLRLRAYLASVCKTDPNTGLQYAWSRSETLIPIDDPCFNQIAEYLATLASE